MYCSKTTILFGIPGIILTKKIFQSTKISYGLEPVLATKANPKILKDLVCCA